jgi:hypothetical protein
VVDLRHLEGLYRQRDDAEVVAGSPIGRGLDIHAGCIGGAA